MIKKYFCVVMTVCMFLMTSCVTKKDASKDFLELDMTGSMEIQYADQFSVDYYEDGYSLITIGDDKYLLVPQEKEIPENTGEMTIIKQPADNIYLAASSAMDLFDGFGGLDSITMTSTDSSGWSLSNITAAIENGDITYIGKYNMPDYEALLECDCKLAIESTMIYHNPETREKIGQLGIPVMVERSSYESHPLGRMEWIKLYGLLLGKYDEAEAYFNEKTADFDALTKQAAENENKKTVAFFYISSNGYVNIRKPGDYISKMIEFAGGRYIFEPKDLNIDDDALSTMNIQIETFYELAKDADILIYNSTIEGKLNSIQQLVDKYDILSDFKAVKDGNVWCTEQNMFQQTTGAADMIIDMNHIFTYGTDDSLTYLHKLY